MGPHGRATWTKRKMRKRRSTELANSIMMKRQIFKGCFLLVEGGDDHLLFKKFINVVTCKIQVAETKDKVVNTIEALESRGFSGVLGVIDADFDRIEGHSPRSINIILLEAHDLETLLMGSTAFDAVLVEFGSQQKIEKFGQDVRDTVVTLAIPIGCLRLYSIRCGLNLKFQGLRYGKFINKRMLSIDLPSLSQEVLNRSERPDLPIEDLEAAIASIKSSGHDPWQICSGDDLVSILGLALNGGALGTKNRKEVSYEKLCQSLRLAYSEGAFAKSRLIGDVQAWERRNPKFQVLK